MNRIDAISCFLTEINELRKTIAYCEGRILRKQIAIEEVQLGLELSESANCPISQTETKCPSAQASAPAIAHSVSAPANPGPSIRALVESILPKLEGRTFWYSDLKTICITAFPEHEKKIRNGISPAVHELVKARKIYRIPNGLTTNPILANL